MRRGKRQTELLPVDRHGLGAPKCLCRVEVTPERIAIVPRSGFPWMATVFGGLAVLGPGAAFCAVAWRGALDSEVPGWLICAIVGFLVVVFLSAGIAGAAYGRRREGKRGPFAVLDRQARTLAFPRAKRSFDLDEVTALVLIRGHTSDEGHRHVFRQLAVQADDSLELVLASTWLMGGTLRRFARHAGLRLERRRARAAYAEANPDLYDYY